MRHSLPTYLHGLTHIWVTYVRFISFYLTPALLLHAALCGSFATYLHTPACLLKTTTTFSILTHCMILTLGCCGSHTAPFAAVLLPPTRCVRSFIYRFAVLRFFISPRFLRSAHAAHRLRRRDATVAAACHRAFFRGPACTHCYGSAALRYYLYKLRCRYNAGFAAAIPRCGLPSGSSARLWPVLTPPPLRSHTLPFTWFVVFAACHHHAGSTDYVLPVPRCGSVYVRCAPCAVPLPPFHLLAKLAGCLPPHCLATTRGLPRRVAAYTVAVRTDFVYYAAATTTAHTVLRAPRTHWTVTTGSLPVLLSHLLPACTPAACGLKLPRSTGSFCVRFVRLLLPYAVHTAARTCCRSLLPYPADLRFGFPTLHHPR